MNTVDTAPSPNGNSTTQKKTDLTSLQQKHIALLKDVLIDKGNANRYQLTPYPPGQTNFLKRFVVNAVINGLAKKNMLITGVIRDGERLRENGLGWPINGYSMIGTKRLNNIQYCIESVVKNDVQGDFIETGVWRGGACIFAKTLFDIYEQDRNVWVADSFEGLPKPNVEEYPEDAGDDLYSLEQLRISKEQVEENFRKFDLLDDKVKFLKGWFKDTLPDAPIDKLAIMRLDGDMYESTMDGLVNLYYKLSPGGFVIIDDYGVIPACKKAVHDFREKHGITEELINIDDSGYYWQKKA
ncbi:class I SAM-dependent methyltransferase [Cryomorphaceae bacterium 1068]|nr:class I SAM-dependent methyltransferase [Cryomorphaceae bacterium 1068]